MSEEKKEPSVAEAMKGKEAVDWQAKAEEYLNGWKRAQADYQNREKEIGKEREVLRGFFEESMVLEFLPVLDNLKNALNTVGHSATYSYQQGGVVKGIEQVVKQFEDILKKFGVERIEVLDKEFDPTLAEAVDRAPSSHPPSPKATEGHSEATKGEEGNKVIKVVADGYKKGDRIIRPARVIVG